jgi:hypothetical protein
MRSLTLVTERDGTAPGLGHLVSADAVSPALAPGLVEVCRPPASNPDSDPTKTILPEFNLS